MDIVGYAKKVRLEAAELLSQTQARGETRTPTQALGAGYTRGPGGLLIPPRAPVAQAPEANKALEDAALKLANAHAQLAAFDTTGPMTLQSLAISAEMRACMAGLAAITQYLSSSNLMAGAAAALENTEAFRQTAGGLWVPAKTS
ncbi:MAG: hypothetical protein ACAI38_24070 [Myxococcota bacterium]